MTKRIVLLLAPGLLAVATGCTVTEPATIAGTVTAESGQMAAKDLHSRGLANAADALLDFFISPAYAYTHIGLSGHNVAICVRGATGNLELAEKAILLDTIAVTDSQGHFSGLKVSGPVYEQRNNGLFVCASSPKGNMTQVWGPIPPRLLEEGGRITVDVSPTETIITRLVCGAPGGVGGWRIDCRGGTPEQLPKLIEAALDKAARPLDARDLRPAFPILRNDPDLRRALEPVLQQRGESWNGAFDSAPSALQAPVVPAPPSPTPSSSGPNKCTPSFCDLCRLANDCASQGCPSC